MTHRDTDGFERVPTRWGFNAYVRAADAERAARMNTRPMGRQSRWFIWELADGTFDYSAVPDPSTPGHPATLVKEIVVGWLSKSQKARAEAEL